MSEQSLRVWTRREALGMLGIGAATAMFSELGSASTPTFPKGSVIRTILKDSAPEELTVVATLFHEQLSSLSGHVRRSNAEATAERALKAPSAAAAPARGAPPVPAPAPVPASGRYFMQDLDLMAEEISAAKSDGIACIVDG